MFDTIVRNCTVVDGTGRPAYRGDIGIQGKALAEIGDLHEAVAKVDLDAGGRIAAPGFIDVHSHADLSLPFENHDEVLKPLVMQGITTFVGGNCGVSNAFIPEENRNANLSYIEKLSGQETEGVVRWKTPAEFMDLMEKRGLLLNTGLLAGHGSLRIAASGLVTRLLTPDEQARLEHFVEAAMEMGCLGLSTGLQYFPGLQSDTRELVGCGRVVRKYGGLFASHLRSYAHTLDLALDEVFLVGRECGIPLQVSHLYWQPYAKGFTSITKLALRAASFAYNTLHIPIPMEKGLAAKLKRFDAVREQGVDVHFDLVPTSQGFTQLAAFLPPYVLEGSREEALARIADTAFRKKVLHDIEHTEPDWPHRDGATWSFNYIKMTGWNGLRVMAVASERNRWMEGKTFPEVGKEQGKHPFDSLCDLLVEEDGRVMVFHSPTIPDDPAIFRSMWAGFMHPRSMPATDTILSPVGRPSHVFYDCFPRFLQIFVKQKKLLSLEEAVHKASALPAKVFGIEKRGTLEKGGFADMIVFDPERIGTQANFHEPRVHPEGVEHVFINGEAVVKDGAFQKGVLPGNVVRRS
jgi:N-acyl-D-aspartate/D-glutamate deacylase